MRKLIIYIVIIIVFVIWFIMIPSEDGIKIYLHNEDKVVKMDFEEYIMNVISAEMPASFEVEALKAQAVAARTYAKRKIDLSEIHPHGADVCTDSTHCQAYRDIRELADEYRKKIRSAVEDTEGEVLIYDGKLVNAVFHSASHGYTERSADVWGGDIPYLQSVASPWDADCPEYIREETFSAEKIRMIFELPSDAPIIGAITRSGAGGVMEIEIGGKVFKGTEVRQKLSLRSTCFTVTENNGVFTFRTEGYGHGVGLSQWGAQGMAKSGYSYDQILKHYYTGANVYQTCTY